MEGNTPSQQPQPQQPQQLFTPLEGDSRSYFTMGRPPTATERAYRERARQRELRQRERQRQQRIATAVRTTIAGIHAPPSSPQQQSLIAPSITTIERTFAIEFSSIPRILRWLPAGFLRPGLESAVLGLLEHPTKFYDFMTNFKDIQYAGESTRYLSLAIMITRMRWAFKRLACVAIRRSIDRRRPLATTDPITLEPIRNPVIVYDMATRWRYAYDPTSLIAYIRTQLTASMYGYPEPQVPRNPITNMNFTLPQLYSINQQLAMRGKQCWQLGAYLSTGAHMSTYLRQHIVSLYRDDCIREVLEHSNPSGQASLVEFILTALTNIPETNRVQLQLVIEHALELPSTRDHPYLGAWRKLYKRSLIECSSVSIDTLVLIHGDDDSMRELSHVAANLVRCFPQFCADVETIINARRAWR
jgi:hypothetical protein